MLIKFRKSYRGRHIFYILKDKKTFIVFNPDGKIINCTSAVN